MGWIPYQSIFRYSLAICWGRFLTSIALSRPDAMALNDGIITYYWILGKYGIFLKLRSSRFWDFMQCWLLVSNWCFRINFQSHLQGSNFWIVWPLTTGPIDCIETSTTNSQSILCNIPEEWGSHLLCCRSPKSHIFGTVRSGLYILHIPMDTTSNILWMRFTGVEINTSIVLLMRIQGLWFEALHSKIIDCWHFEGTFCP